MRTILMVLVAAAATAYAQDWRAATAKASRAVVHIEADDRAFLRALEARRNKAPLKVLAGIRVHQPYRLVLSGVVISPDGEILTCALHPRADLRVTVTFAGGAKKEATIVGTDPLSNLALLKVPQKTADHLELGGAVRKNETVAIVGCDPSHRAVSTLGPVIEPQVSVRLEDMYGVTKERAISLGTVFEVGTPATRALVNGSACVDGAGRLLGLQIGNMPSQRGIVSVALPAARIARILKDLRAHGRVLRAEFGVRLDHVSAAVRNHFQLPDSACSIKGVELAGPAARGGLKRNDIILKLDGKDYRDPHVLGEAMSDKTPGKPVDFEVLRAGKKLTVPVTPR